MAANSLKVWRCYDQMVLARAFPQVDAERRLALIPEVLTAQTLDRPIVGSVAVMS
jgi:hypothetical protein